MKKKQLLVILLLVCSINGNSQLNNDISTQSFAKDFKKLIDLNSSIENLINLSGKEYINISTNATASQIIAITNPYLQSQTINAKGVCLALLNEALLKKAETQKQKQEIVEILCKNYVNREGIQTISSLLLMQESDFNPNAKRYVSALIDSLPMFAYGICFKLLGLAQIRESILVLWKMVNNNIANYGQDDLDILASLARMNEKEAGVLLCNYYNSLKGKADYRRVFIAKRLAFSLDEMVLNCLVNNYKTIDIKKVFRDGDTGYQPSQVLGAAITSMLKNYPYLKEELDPRKLLDWLQESKNYEIGGK